MSTTLVAMRPRPWVLALAVPLFAGILALRLIVPGPEYAVSYLFFIPVVLIAIEYGLVAGAVAAATALVLAQAGNLIAQGEVPLASYGSRGIAFFSVGVLTGYMGERLRRNALALREGARHFELSNDLLCTADFEGRLLHVNESWEGALGWSREELLEIPFLELVHPDDREATVAEASRAQAGDRAVEFTNRYRTRDGGYRWLEWSSRADSEARLIYAVARDVTERREAERAQEEAQMRFRHIFDHSSAGIALVGMDGQIIEANQTLAEFLGRTPEELVGSNTLAEFAEAGSIHRIATGIEGLMAGSQDVYNDELRVKRSDGELIWVNLTMSLIRDADGTPLYRLSQLLDVQAQREAEDQLRHQAEHDPLSGVFNRRRFETELARELAHDAQGARSSAVLVFDVDEFKQVNDTLGHGTGDAVIVTLGSALEQRVRTGDVVARLGGDEFAVLMRRININDAQRVADNIREHARDELTRLVEGAVPLGVSVGVAMVDGARKDTPEQLVERADMAMYEAKRRGGDRVAVAEGASPVPEAG